MARTFANHSGKGDRVPLGKFSEPITILRVGSTPSPDDESWVRNSLKIGDMMVAYEAGEVRLVKGEQVSSKELHLFLMPQDSVYEFTLSDYVIYGNRVFHVQGFQIVQFGNRKYMQINTLPWGDVRTEDWNVTPDAPVPPATAPPSTGNLFWS